jgi:VWFA-related protein
MNAIRAVSRACSVGLALVPVVALVAQERATPPAFKAGTEIILVDFVVTDKSDRPVTGLTAADFVVKDDGKERPIVSFAAFADPSPAAAAAGTATRPAAGTVLLVDDGHLDAGQTLRLRPDLKALLAKVGSRSGTLSLVSPSSGVSEGRTLPFGAEALSNAVDRIAGHRIDDHTDLPIADAEAIAIERGDTQVLKRLADRFMAINGGMKADQAEALTRARAREVATEARVRRQALYDAADLAFDWLASQPGRHSLVLVSPGFARDPEDPGYDRVVTRSLRVNAPISFLDARGLEGFGRFDSVTSDKALPAGAGETGLARMDAAQGAAVLADDTGGVIVRNTNDLQEGLGRLFDTMSNYYVVGYERVPQTKSGFRKIKVETKAKGLSVRARRGYFDDVKK